MPTLIPGPGSFYSFYLGVPPLVLQRGPGINGGVHNNAFVKNPESNTIHVEVPEMEHHSHIVRLTVGRTYVTRYATNR